LIGATSGEIIIDGADITKFNDSELRQFRRSTIAMVFQNFGLLPHKNVLDNASYGLEVKGINKQDRYALANEILEKVGLSGWEHATPHELSGGMQQRVGLARALAVNPSILLMDEPFSGLDPLIRRQMREELAVLQAEIQKTLVFITHDLDEAITVGDRIAIMRDGEIIQLGTPKEIITNPIDDFVKEFTQGISKTKVVDVAHILSAPKAVFSKSDSVDVVWKLMEQAQSDYAIGLIDGTQYIGILSRGQLNIPSTDAAVERCDAVSVRTSTTLQEALPLLSNNDLPLPVVDDGNAFVGVVTQGDLLKMLASDT
jgi:glycine betaine/proline transport system ATP-binding protein